MSSKHTLYLRHTLKVLHIFPTAHSIAHQPRAMTIYLLNRVLNVRSFLPLPTATPTLNPILKSYLLFPSAQNPGNGALRKGARNRHKLSLYQSYRSPLFRRQCGTRREPVCQWQL